MKELDVLLSRYLERGYPAAPAAEQDAFRRLLEMQDPEIYALLTARADAGDQALANVVARIQVTARD